jgi:hypothetical protein
MKIDLAVFKQFSIVAQRVGPLALAGTSFLATAGFADATFYNGVSQEMIAFFALIMAGVLPTAALAATVLRSGGLTEKSITDYQTALLGQLTVWAGLFFLSLIGSACLIIGKAIDWKIPIPFSLIGLPNFDAGIILTGVTSAVFVLLLTRFSVVFVGLRSLIELSGEIAVSEIRLRDSSAAAQTQRPARQLPERPGFGNQI